MKKIILASFLFLACGCMSKFHKNRFNEGSLLFPCKENKLEESHSVIEEIQVPQEKSGWW